MITKYLVKYNDPWRGESLIGRQDVEFDKGFDDLMEHYSLMKYGFNTVASAKRSPAYQNKTINPVIVKCDIVSGKVTLTELKEDVK